MDHVIHCKQDGPNDALVALAFPHGVRATVRLWHSGWGLFMVWTVVVRDGVVVRDIHDSHAEGVASNAAAMAVLRLVREFSNASAEAIAALPAHQYPALVPRKPRRAGRARVFLRGAR